MNCTYRRHYLIKWVWDENEWKPIDIIKPNEHTHYFNEESKIKYISIGTEPLEYNNIYTRWISTEISV